MLEHELNLYVDAVLTGDVPSVERLKAPRSDLALLLGRAETTDDKEKAYDYYREEAER